MRALPLLSLALLAPAAHAQLFPVSRSSHLVSHDSWYREDDAGSTNYDETLTAWESGFHTFGHARENLTLGLGRIAASVSLGGSSNDNRMQRSGYSFDSSYTGEFVFDLRTTCTFNLSGVLNCAYGNARISFFDVTRGATLFTLPSQALRAVPYSTSGELDPGRYRLLLQGTGVPMGGGGPGDSIPSMDFTVVPSPAAFAVLLLAAAGPRRRRARGF